MNSSGLPWDLFSILYEMTRLGGLLGNNGFSIECF